MRDGECFFDSDHAKDLIPQIERERFKDGFDGGLIVHFKGIEVWEKLTRLIDFKKRRFLNQP
jgi:hypothetical protein